MRDQQREKVYRGERQRFGDAIYTERLSLDQCRQLAASLYGKRVIVKDGRGRRNACAFNRSLPTIALPRWARNEIVVAHEVAHLHTFRAGKDLPAHGSTFMRKYLNLLLSLGHPQDVEDDARAFGLKVRR